MTRNGNHGDDDASSEKTITGGVVPWSNLDPDLLHFVMMKTRVVDFIAFSKVCKSWRSLALSNWNMFMDSKTPMPVTVRISDDVDETECSSHPAPPQIEPQILSRSNLGNSTTNGNFDEKECSSHPVPPQILSRSNFGHSTTNGIFCS